MAWANPNSPNLPDFELFVRDFMQIGIPELPDDSAFFGYAFDQAIELVIRAPAGSGFGYTLAVYNCAGHILVRITPDQTGLAFFQNLRTTYGLLKLTAGLILSASDDGTSDSVAIPDALKQLTLSDLSFMRTPWGREMLAYQQDFGGLFGLS
jgi:hypothetical protein